jgi:hypothetical protein
VEHEARLDVGHRVVHARNRSVRGAANRLNVIAQVRAAIASSKVGSKEQTKAANRSRLHITPELGDNPVVRRSRPSGPNGDAWCSKALAG